MSNRAPSGAHQKNLKVQGKHSVNYLQHWFDEGSGNVFCLVDAPSKETAEAVHRESHGLVADEITEVQEGAWAPPGHPHGPGGARRRAPQLGRPLSSTW